MTKNNLTKINFTEKNETVTFEFNLSEECKQGLNDRLELRVKQVNADLKAGIIDKKTASEKLERLTFDKIAGDFIKKIVNALSSSAILTDKKYTINKTEINTNKKRLAGGVSIVEINSLIAEINEFLTIGRVKITEINPKSPCMIRNTKYVIAKSEKQYITHEFISMTAFNTLDKDIRSKISGSKHVIFDNITVVNQ